MKVKGSYRPQPFEFERIGDKAILRFYENVEEISGESEDGTPTTGWSFDRYTVECPYDTGLQGRVEQHIAEWLSTARKREIETLAKPIRAERNRLLADTDRTQLPDAPEDVEIKNAYRNYRQALRDIPEQAGFPYSVEFPQPVAAL